MDVDPEEPEILAYSGNVTVPSSTVPRSNIGGHRVTLRGRRVTYIVGGSRVTQEAAESQRRLQSHIESHQII